MDVRRINTLLVKATHLLNEGAERLFVKCNSHRARSRLTPYVKNPVWYCSFRRGVGKGVCMVTAKELAEIRKHKPKGITKFKDGEDLFKCWSMK